MITITSEYLDANWKALMDTSILPTQFSEWDAGDAYTLSAIGILPSRQVAFGVVVLEDARVSDFPIVIRLRKSPGDESVNVYRCPDGTKYEATAERVADGATISIPVRVDSITKSISARRRGLLETDLLKDSCVLIVGLGTGGITVALELAKAGVGKFVLVHKGGHGGVREIHNVNSPAVVAGEVADVAQDLDVLELPTRGGQIGSGQERTPRVRDVDDRDARAVEGSEVGEVTLPPDVSVSVGPGKRIELR